MQTRFRTISAKSVNVRSFTGSFPIERVVIRVVIDLWIIHVGSTLNC